MQAPSPAPVSRLDLLRAEVRAIEVSRRRRAAGSVPFGIGDIDHILGGGLEVALHELAGGSNSLNDNAAATLFIAGIAARTMGGKGVTLWVMRGRDLFAPSLAQAGLPPNRLIYAECARDEEVLAVMEEGLRHGGLGAVVGEVDRVTMTASRRLQLAAEDGATMALMLRRWPRGGGDPLGAPSAAETRWRIGCAPSQQLAAQGIARARWRIDLVRQRGGQPHQWIMEGTDEAGRLALPAGPAHRPAAAGRADARQVA